MKRFDKPAGAPVFVAIDVAKARHHVLIELPDGRRTALSVANTLVEFDKLADILGLTILSEAGDLRRFSHYRKFLKYCGFDLSASQSGTHRGSPQLSKRGNARLRCAFWMAARAAVAQRRNGFRKKYDDYTRRDPQNVDLRRKAYTAVAAKMARVSYGLIKSDEDYRHLTA